MNIEPVVYDKDKAAEMLLNPDHHGHFPAVNYCPLVRIMFMDQEGETQNCSSVVKEGSIYNVPADYLRDLLDQVIARGGSPVTIDSYKHLTAKAKAH